jgi:hypothetical protein
MSITPDSSGWMMESEKPKSPDTGTAGPRQTLREILRWVEEEPGRILEAFPGLPFAEQLGVLLLTPGQFRLDLLLSSPLAGELVPMLPEQEVYLTLKEIGLEDALPMLSLMTREQLHYVNDLEAWHKESFEAPAFLKFVRMIHQCGEDKLADWLDTADPELLVLFLKECGSVTKFDITEDQVEAPVPHASITYDGFYRYHPKRQEFAPLLDPVLRILNTSNPERFGMVMESAYRDLPAEIEEEALRFRSRRLAEKGMPGFEEACEIYRPLTDEKFIEYTAQAPSNREPSTETPALFPIRWLPADSFFREVLATLSDHPETDRIRTELASLGNKVLIAEGMDVASGEPLKMALKRVADTLTLALEHLAGKNIQEAASWLTRAWLHHLFRLGMSQTRKLAERARRVRDRAGFPWIDRFHLLADSPLGDALQGLLKPRPLFYEGPAEEGLAEFRDFAGMEDLRISEARISATEALAGLFSEHLHASPGGIKQACLEAGLGDQLDRVSWSEVLQTAWVHQTLSGRPEFRPLTPAEAQEFLQEAFVEVAGTSARRLDPAFTHNLLDWALDRAGAPGEEAEEIIREWIRSGTTRIEEELAGLDPEKPLDSRFVKCLCIREQTLTEGQR